MMTCLLLLALAAAAAAETIAPGGHDCSAPMHRGDKATRFYYNGELTKRGVCIRFKYRGTGGNTNNFGSQEECENTCFRVPTTIQKPIPITTTTTPKPITPKPDVITLSASESCAWEFFHAFTECDDKECIVECADIMSCLSSGRTVWGHGTYTADSGLCRAAVDAGVIPVTGGVVTVVSKPGQSLYEGSDVNGVLTKSYDSYYGASSAFEHMPITTTQKPTTQKPTTRKPTTREPEVTLSASESCAWECLHAFAECDDKECVVECADITSCLSSGRTVWGHGTYTNDSGICRAAVNAGGVVTVVPKPGQSSYEASDVNGVLTQRYDSYYSASCAFE